MVGPDEQDTSGKKIIMSIGIGITTRNRPDVLSTALAHFSMFGYGDKMVIVDDNSDTYEQNKKVIEESGINVTYRYSDKRLGIARAKNACLAKLKDVDHVFIFDDDTWPSSENWAQKWVDINKHNNVGHSLWNVFIRPSTKAGEPGADIEILSEYITAEWSSGKNAMRAWTQCLGVMLYFSRECLDAIGGYDNEAKTVYGYEHAQMSKRANKAGFCNGYDYISPVLADELIYSFDISYGWMGKQSPIEIPWKERFTTSVSPEEAKAHPQNAFLMSKNDIHIPLVDPLEEPNA